MELNMQISKTSVSPPLQNRVRVIKDEEIQSDISINPNSSRLFFSTQNQDALPQNLKRPNAMESTEGLVARHSNGISQENNGREVFSKATDPSSDAKVAPKEKHPYWKKISILVLTFAIALAKLLEPIIRSKFTPEAKT